MGAYVRQRAKDRIAELAGRGLDLVTFWQECSEVISPVVPFYLTPCFYTLDPASLLITSHYHDGLPELPHEWLALEYYQDDCSKLADVARSQRGVATLHEATGGDLSLSARYRTSIQPLGGDQEALVACARPPVRRGESSRSIARRASPGSIATSSSSCGTSQDTWPRAPAARC